MKALLGLQFYRISADPFLGGVPGERQASRAYPERCRQRVVNNSIPPQIKPFADALRQASAFAVEAMGSKLDPLRALNVGEAIASVDGERTPVEQRLAALLKQQAELANDISPEGEAQNTWPWSPTRETVE